jgi:hypothetical protein
VDDGQLRASVGRIGRDELKELTLVDASRQRERWESGTGATEAATFHSQ